MRDLDTPGPALLALGVLFIWPVWAGVAQRPPPVEFERLALDIGQGSAVLVRTAGHSLMFDTGPRYGPGADAGHIIVVPMLRVLEETLDTVVVSHRDSDHAGGSAAARATWPGARWISSFEPSAASRCLAGQHWRWEGVGFEMLHPGTGHFEDAAQRQAVHRRHVVRAADQQRGQERMAQW